MTEKHKMNVPETMNEALDMSDDEGNHVTCDVIVLGLIMWAVMSYETMGDSFIKQTTTFEREKETERECLQVQWR